MGYRRFRISFGGNANVADAKSNALVTARPGPIGARARSGITMGLRDYEKVAGSRGTL